MQERHARRLEVLREEYDSLREEAIDIQEAAWREAFDEATTVSRQLTELTDNVVQLRAFIHDQRGELQSALPGSDVTLVKGRVDELQSAVKDLKIELLGSKDDKLLVRSKRGAVRYLREGMAEILKAPFTLVGLIAFAFILNFTVPSLMSGLASFAEHLAQIARFERQPDNRLTLDTAAKKN